MDPPCKPCAKFTIVPLLNFIIICTFIFIIVTSILTWVYFAQHGVLNKTIELKEDIVIPFLKNKENQNYKFTPFAASASQTTKTVTIGSEDLAQLLKTWTYGTKTFGFSNDPGVNIALNPLIPNVYTGSGPGTPLFPIALSANNAISVELFIFYGTVTITSVVKTDRSVDPDKTIKLF
jgi:hypothetical protein